MVKLTWWFDSICQADQSGTVAEILVEDGKPVSVDTVSFYLPAPTPGTFSSIYNMPQFIFSDVPLAPYCSLYSPSCHDDLNPVYIQSI